MLKKIALVGIFAVVTVVSFGTSTASATHLPEVVPSVRTPVPHGMGSCFPGGRC